MYFFSWQKLFLFLLTLSSEGRVAVEIFNVFFCLFISNLWTWNEILFYVGGGGGVFFRVLVLLFLGRRIFAVLFYPSGKRFGLLVLTGLFFLSEKWVMCWFWLYELKFSNQKEWEKEALQPALPLSDFSFALPFSSCVVLVPGLV